MTELSALTIAMAQYSQLPIGKPFGRFANSVRHVVDVHSTAGARPELVIFPEMHLFGTGDLPQDQARRSKIAAATDFHDELTENLKALAKELGIWLIPGTVPEQDGEDGAFNTAPVFSPAGELVTTYRKICPWRPFEQYTPGDSFAVFDIPGKGRIGLTICYDAWFPEISRQVAWLGADMIVNLVRTTTPDRRQELVLARANAIVNQTFLASINAAAPQGVGESVLVDPEGNIIRQITGSQEGLITATVQLDQVRRIHQTGTSGTNKVWEQFRPGDSPVPLPLYEGRIDPDRWSAPVD